MVDDEALPEIVTKDSDVSSVSKNGNQQSEILYLNEALEPSSPMEHMLGAASGQGDIDISMPTSTTTTTTSPAGQAEGDLNQIQLMILVFTSRIVVIIICLVILQCTYALTDTYVGLVTVTNVVGTLLQLGLALMNYICTAYLYGFYPQELLEFLRRVSVSVLHHACCQCSCRRSEEPS